MSTRWRENTVPGKSCAHRQSAASPTRWPTENGVNSTRNKSRQPTLPFKNEKFSREIARKATQNPRTHKHLCALYSQPWCHYDYQLFAIKNYERTDTHTHTVHEQNVGTDCTYIIKGGFLNIILGHSCAATAVPAACDPPHHISFRAHPYTRPRVLYYHRLFTLATIYLQHSSTFCMLRDMLWKNYCMREFSYYIFVTYSSHLIPFIKSLFCIRKHLVWYTFPAFVCLVLLYIVLCRYICKQQQ